MAVTPTPIFPQSILNTVVQFTHSTGTAVTTLLAGPANGAKIESINVSNTDTNSYSVNVYIVNGGTNYLLTTGTIPASSGNASGTASVSLMDQTNWPSLRYDSNGNHYMYLGTGYTLSAALSGTLTTGSLMTFFIQGGNF